MTLKRYKASQGFTLIEVLVSVAILAIMAAVTIASLSGSRNRQEVGGAARVVAAILRDAQNNALAGKNITGVSSSRPCQFRVRTIPGTGTIWHEQLNAGSVSCPNLGGPSLDVWSGASTDLLNGVKFSASPTEARFDVPRGEPRNLAGAPLTSIPVDFSITKGPDTAHVCVYPLGRIEETAVGASCP